MCETCFTKFHKNHQQEKIEIINDKLNKKIDEIQNMNYKRLQCIELIHKRSIKTMKTLKKNITQ